MTKRRKRRGPKPKPVPRRMPPRQLAFCPEYLKHYNGTKAAIAVGYAQRGAHVTASRLLRHPKVSKELARLAAQVKKKAELSAVAVLESVTAVALGDVRQLFEKNEFGRSVLKEMLDLSPQAQALVAGYSEKDGRIELKLENRTRSKEMLMKHHRSIGPMGLLKEHIRLETASELTVEEDEVISKMSDEELREFREANETVERLLHPEEAA